MEKKDVMMVVCISAVLMIMVSVGSASIYGDCGDITHQKKPKSSDPICINGNLNFTGENGVTDGNGTESNPFIIENLDVDASTANGIEIRNTDKHFIIRNSTVQNGTSNNHGIYFYNVTNGEIDNVSSYNNECGIYFVSSSNSSITNCTVYNNSDVSIYFEVSNNNSVTNCEVYNANVGIYIDFSSNNNQISNSRMYDNEYSIIIYSCSDNIIINCTIHDNIVGDGMGILFDYANNNQIIGCGIYGNRYGVWFEHSSNNSITGSPIHDNDGAGIYFDESSGNNIANCDCYNNSNYGIFLNSFSNNNQITECLLHNNSYSIYLYDSREGNQITDSTLYNNSNYAIYITESTHVSTKAKSCVYHNNFINSSISAYDDSENTVWDNGYLFGGNYWDNYTGIDANGDGIGDIPCSVSGGSNQDNYPFINPIEYVPPTVNSTLPDNGDVNVSVDTNITIVFSEPINKLNIKGNITTSPEIGIEAYNWSEDNKTLILTRSSELPSYTNYNVTINTNVKDLSQNNLQNPYNFSFRTKDVTSPDANAGDDEEIDEDIAVYFDGSNSTDNSGVIANYTWTFMDNNTEIKLYGVNPDYTFTQPGYYVIILNVSDSAGNWAVDILNITVKDITPPVITILSPANNTITNQSMTLVYFVSDNFDDAGNITVTGPSNNTIYDDEGEYTVTINATDAAGNNASKTIVFIIDKTPPTITIISPEDGLITNQNVTLSYLFTDNVSSVENITVSGDESPYTQEGSYSIILTATDQAGNNMSQTITFTIDKTPPTVSDLSPVTGTKTTDASMVVSGKTEPNVTVQINYVNVNVSSDGSFTREINLVNGYNIITITATDTAGNTVIQNITIERTEEEEEMPKYLIYIIPISIVFVVALIAIILFLKRKIKIRCPACKTVFDVKPGKKPLKIKCLKCGKEGVLT